MGMKKATRDNIVGNACFEALEDRRLMSSVQLVDGMLIIQGNVRGANRLSVTPDAGGQTLFAHAGKAKAHYQLKDVKSIRIFGGVNKDVVEIDSAIKVNSYIKTNAGKDL